MSDALLVQAEWLQTQLGRKDLVVIDCATNIVADADGHEKVVPEYEAFLKEHIPGARFVDLQGALSDPDSAYDFMDPGAARLERGLRALGINDGDTVVVYSSGNPWWATRVWWLLQGYGFAGARVLDGGLKYWKRLGLPVQPGEAEPWAPGRVRIDASRAPRTVNAQQLLARLGAPDLALVNALPPAKFAGEEAVHGGRPGRIPGSLNLPAGSLVDPATGKFVPAAQREQTLRGLDLLDGDRDVVAYCGGGVSATFVLFALALAGRADATLYDASLAEWAKRADLPIEITQSPAAKP